jgi:putative ABC transport system permease protein
LAIKLLKKGKEVNMWTLFKLAFRNIFRFKRRTFITLSAISVGLGLLILSICLMNGLDKQSISNIINCQTSHIKIFKAGYFEKRDELPMDITIKDPDRIRSLLKDVPGILGTESRVLFGAGLIKGMDELPCLGVAVDLEINRENLLPVGRKDHAALRAYAQAQYDGLGFFL